MNKSLQKRMFTKTCANILCIGKIQVKIMRYHCMHKISRWLSAKESACHCRRYKKIQVWALDQEDPSGGGNGNLLQYSCQRNPMNRRTWRVIVHRVSKSQTRLSDWVYEHHIYTVDNVFNVKAIACVKSPDFPLTGRNTDLWYCF